MVVSSQLFSNEQFLAPNFGFGKLKANVMTHLLPIFYEDSRYTGGIDKVGLFFDEMPSPFKTLARHVVHVTGNNGDNPFANAAGVVNGRG